MPDRVHFLNLLLNTAIKQRKAILQWLTPDQLKFISEIVINLLEHLPLDSLEKKQLKHKRFVKRLAKGKISAATKQRLIRRHWKSLDSILQFFKTKLLQAVSLTY